MVALDRAARTLTIRHGALHNLAMPPMTMAFQVGDPVLLDRVSAGDKVRFHADVASGGTFTVTRIERAVQ